MESRGLFLLALSLLALTSAASATATLRRSALAGGYQPIDPKDAHVVEIAQFAISEHNKLAGTKLKYVEVVRGDKQVVHGIKYRLIITGEDAGTTHNYAAEVDEGVSGKEDRKLVMFHISPKA